MLPGRLPATIRSRCAKVVFRAPAVSIAGPWLTARIGQTDDKALAAAGIVRDEVYVTNAVKHFKWELRGKRRLHKTPTQREIDACGPWLREELALIGPRAIACLGATAARAVFGKPLKIGASRGQLLVSAYASRTLVTAHPSSILRLREAAGRTEAFNGLVADLRLVGALL